MGERLNARWTEGNVRQIRLIRCLGPLGANSREHGIGVPPQFAPTAILFFVFALAATLCSQGVLNPRKTHTNGERLTSADFHIMLQRTANLFFKVQQCETKTVVHQAYRWVSVA